MTVISMQPKKRKKVLYTNQQVRQILGIDSMRLTRLVRSGDIKKFIPPGKKHGLYDGDDVERLKRLKQNFADSYVWKGDQPSHTRDSDR